MNEVSQMQSEKINELVTALVKAQSELNHAKRDASNPHFKNDYATLESVIDATREPLAKNGLVALQPIVILPDGKSAVATLLVHTSGQFIRSLTPILNNKNDAQGLGSGITYARRFGLSAMIGISQTDDDGTTASNRLTPRAPGKKPKANAPTPVEEF
jgi:hypothetical protein